MIFHPHNFLKRSLPIKTLALLATIMLTLTFSQNCAAQKAGVPDEVDLRNEIANIHFQVARGHDEQGDIRQESGYRAKAETDSGTAGDELDLAGDEKYWASEGYQTAMKQWERAAKNFRTAGKLDKTKIMLDSADSAWEYTKRSLQEAIELHRKAQAYFQSVNNIERKTAVLAKLARNLERLVDLKR